MYFTNEPLPLARTLLLSFAPVWSNGLPGGQTIRRRYTRVIKGAWEFCRTKRLASEGIRVLQMCVCGGGFEGKLLFLFCFSFPSLNTFSRRVSPEDIEMANELHISVNIRYPFPLQPVNTDKRQHCVALW